jgi:hypothetical protein
LGELVPLVLEPQEDDGDPEVSGERIDPALFVFDGWRRVSPRATVRCRAWLVSGWVCSQCELPAGHASGHRSGGEVFA